MAVPDGTMVKTEDGEELADLIGAGTRFVAAQGGRGGLGNAALATPRRKAPGFALRGEPGTEHVLVLELKTVADAGLVGTPTPQQVLADLRSMLRGPAQRSRRTTCSPRSPRTSWAWVEADGQFVGDSRTCPG